MCASRGLGDVGYGRGDVPVYHGRDDACQGRGDVTCHRRRDVCHMVSCFGSAWPWSRGLALVTWPCPGHVALPWSRGLALVAGRPSPYMQRFSESWAGHRREPGPELGRGARTRAGSRRFRNKVQRACKVGASTCNARIALPSTRTRAAGSDARTDGPGGAPT